MTANSRLQISEQGASVIGPAVAGWLITLLTAPFAVAADVLSYVLSAVLLGSINKVEARPEAEDAHQVGFVKQISEGLSYVFRHSILRALGITSGIIQFFGRMAMAVLLIYLVRVAGLNGAAVGTVLSIGSVGFVVGAVIAPRVSRQVGLGRTLTASALVASLSPLFYALSPVKLAAPFASAGFFLYGVAALCWTVNSVSLRQAVTPGDKLGRVSATLRLMSWGAIPLGALLGGILGSTVGLRQALAIAALGGLGAALPALLSGMARITRLNEVGATASA